MTLLISCTSPSVPYATSGSGSDVHTTVAGTRSQTAPESKAIRPLPDIITHGSRDKKEIALTFDAEMTPGMKQRVLNGGTSFDAKIIDTLNSTHTKATIFLTGMWTELYPDAVKQFAANPLFELASHSYFDEAYTPNCFKLLRVTERDKADHILKTQKLIQDTAGVTSKYFRFPGGCYAQKDLDLVTKLGLTVVHWDVTGNDGFNNNAPHIEQTVLNKVQNGSIIVLHLNGAPTAPKTSEALPTIIKELKKKGFVFVTVSELLNTESLK